MKLKIIKRDGVLLMKAADPIGTVSTRKDGTTWMKIAEDKWAPVKHGKQGLEHDDTRHGLHIQKDKEGNVNRASLTDKKDIAARVKSAIETKNAQEAKSGINATERGQRQEHHIEKKETPKSHEDLKVGHVVRVNPDKLVSKEDEKKGGIVGKIKEIKGRFATLVHAGGKEVEVPLHALAFQKASLWARFWALLKADRAHLVAKKVSVTRGGHTFQTTVYVLPGATPTQIKQQASDSIIDVFPDLHIKRYGDKALVISGNTIGNLSLMREIKNAIGLGGYNDKLKGWVFPASKETKIREMMANRLTLMTPPPDATKEEVKQTEEAIKVAEFDNEMQPVDGKVEGKEEIKKAEEVREEASVNLMKERRKQYPSARKSKDNVQNAEGFVDVGEKIGGARKDLAALERQYRDERDKIMSPADLASIESDSPAVAQQLIDKYRQAGVKTLSDFSQMLQQSGTSSPGAAFVAEKLFRAIDGKPKDKAIDRENYVEAMRQFMLAATGWRNSAEAEAGASQLQDEICGFYAKPEEMAQYNEFKSQYDALAVRSRVAAKKAHEIEVQLWRKDGKFYSEQLAKFKSENPKVNVSSSAGHTRFSHALYSAIQDEVKKDDIANGAEVKAIREQMSALNTAIRGIQQRGSEAAVADPKSRFNMWNTLGENFARAVGVPANSDSRTRRQKVRMNLSTLVSDAKKAEASGEWPGSKQKIGEAGGTKAGPAVRILKPTKIDWSRFTKNEDIRTGAESVTYTDSQKLMSDFGLRGIECGNWMDAEASRIHTQRAGEAFHDFSAILGVDAKSLSLNGRLALAFGARGKGGKGAGVAHYESGRKVINLTKMAGGGSLAHEWGHALDNILALAGSGGTKQLSFGMDEAENPKAFAASADYSAMPANVMEAIVGVHKAMHEGTFIPKKAVMVQPSENRKFRDHGPLNERLAKNNGNGTEALSQMIKERENAIDLRYSPADPAEYIQRYRARALANLSKDMKTNAEYYAWKTGGPVTYHVSTGKPTTSYAATARMTSAYMADPKEMFARAFEAYTQDALAEKGITNTYLVSNAVHDMKWQELAKKNPIVAALLKEWEPFVGIHSTYPQGEERKRINGAIKNLIEQVKANQMLQKAAVILDDEQRRADIAILMKARQVTAPLSKAIDRSKLIKRKITEKTGISRYHYVRAGGEITASGPGKKKDLIEPKSSTQTATWRQHLTPPIGEYNKMASGDQAALATYWNRVFNTANPETGTTVISKLTERVAHGASTEGFESSDVSQEVGIQLLNNQRAGKLADVPREKFASYVAQVMSNLVHKMAAGRKAYHEAVADVSEFASQMATPEEAVIEKESTTLTPESKVIENHEMAQKTHAIVQEVIRSMPAYNRDRNKEIFKHYLAGMQHKDIAVKMGITELASRKVVAVINKKVGTIMARMKIPVSGKRKMIREMSQQYIGQDVYKMAARDVSKLTKKVITNSKGQKQTVYVRTGEQVPAGKDKKGSPEKPSGKSKGGLKERIKNAIAKFKEARGKKDGPEKQSAMKDAAKGFLDSIFTAMRGGNSEAELGQTAQEAGDTAKQNEKTERQHNERKAREAESKQQAAAKQIKSKPPGQAAGKSRVVDSAIVARVKKQFGLKA